MLNWMLLLVMSTLGLLVYLRLAPKFKLVDEPNDRSLHHAPTVVGAGAVPMLLLTWAFSLSSAVPQTNVIAFLLLGLVLIGLWDDWRGVSSSLRLICYVAAGLALSALLHTGAEVPWWSIVTTGLAVAWCINLVNFMDGVDGLVTVHVLCTAVGLGLVAAFHPSVVVSRDLLMLCAALVACFAPLLWLNWPPARVFMGDAGAVPLGFFLAVLGMLAVDTHASLGYVWLILMMPMLVDTGITLLIRLLTGHAPHVAHRDHGYQRLALRAGSPMPVTLGLLAMHVVWLFPLAVTVVTTALFPLLLVLLSAIPSLFLVVYARGRD